MRAIVASGLALFGLTLWPNESIIQLLHLGGLLESNPLRVSYELVAQCKIFASAVCLVVIAYCCRVDGARALHGFWSGVLRDRAVLFWLFAILLVSNQFLRPAIWDGNLIDGLGGFYANLSLNPFHGIDSNWFYRRAFMPLLAHLLQLKGPLLFGVFSLALSAVLMVLFKHILDRIHRFGFVELLALFTMSLVNFSFLQIGYPDVLVAIILLASIFLDMQTRTRVALFALALLTHDMAAIVLFPYLLLFTNTRRLPVLALAGGYTAFWLASFGFSWTRLVASQDTPALWRMVPDFFDMYLLSFVPALGFAWVAFLIHLVQPWKHQKIWWQNLTLVLCVVVLSLLGTDTGRFAALLLLGCLTLWQTRGINRFDLWLIRLSLLLVPFFSGIGQRSLYVPDLLLAIHRWLDLPSFGFRLL